jgi:hypothetical protein
MVLKYFTTYQWTLEDITWLIFMLAMKEFPNTLKAHPEFMFPGSDDFLK